MVFSNVPINIPKDAHIIFGQSHFIKTVEDIYEAIVNTVPQMKFGVAFNEASGPCLTRVDGNDEALKALAARNATALAAGHVFVGDGTRSFDEQTGASGLFQAGRRIGGSLRLLL